MYTFYTRNVADSSSSCTDNTEVLVVEVNLNPNANKIVIQDERQKTHNLI